GRWSPQVAVHVSIADNRSSAASYPLSLHDALPICLLGHWGTTPGLNFIYVHLNRIIREREVNMIFVTGPGHGGPALVANTWLERSGEHTSELQSRGNLVCRLLLEKQQTDRTRSPHK